MDKKVTLDRMPDEVDDILRRYNNAVIIGIKDTVGRAAKELVKRTRRDANRRTGGYRKHIRSKVQKETPASIEHLWYVIAPDYRRTHLLIRPHRTRNGGMTTGNDFLTDNVDQVKNDMLKKIEEVVKNGY